MCSSLGLRSAFVRVGGGLLFVCAFAACDERVWNGQKLLYTFVESPKGTCTFVAIWLRRFRFVLHVLPSSSSHVCSEEVEIKIGFFSVSQTYSVNESPEISQIQTVVRIGFPQTF